MQQWTGQVLQPYIQQRAQGCPVTLFLDGISAHRSEQMTAAAATLGVNVLHILAECTSVNQPVNVGIGKPFKD